ncbi:hypothetical protein ACMAZF_01305 [Psychrobium sp. nBUS_13]|uniref:hypothetical protein n=1 Tax=Psychrobium sp. nBUS_13 TaxID=3395319 RepID=UPI003EBF0BB8
MWESLLGIADGLVESVGEGVTQVLDGRVDLEVQKLQETRKDPDVLKAVEPVKATRTDGSTIVGDTNKAGEVVAPKPMFMGMDKQTLMIGGGVLTALIVGVAVIARGRG